MCKELCGRCLYAYAYSHLLALCECHLFFCDYDAETIQHNQTQWSFYFSWDVKKPHKMI